MDLSTLPAPVFTGLEAATQAVAGLCYLAVGLFAWLKAPRDIRTRVFFALSLSNVAVLAVPAVWWVGGLTDPAKLPRPAMAVVFAALGVTALLLFHFTQVFPRRRPWIRTAGIQMTIVYTLTPLSIAGLVWYMPRDVADLAQLSVPYIIALLVFGFPLLVLLGLVLPVAAIVSLIRSHQDMTRAALVRLKRPIEWILVSQIAGGTLAVVFAPVLAVLAPNSAAQTILTLIICALGLLTPIAVAAAVWQYDLLSVDPE